MVSHGTSDEKSRPMTKLNMMTCTTADRDDNGVALAATPIDESDIASILIVEHDADCADALETILSDLPGIATVQTAASAGDAFDLLDDGSYDVVGFGMLPDTVPPSTPDIIFIGAHQPDSAEIELELVETLTSFRRRVPDASIVLLCVYPSRYRDTLGELVDGCIRKDTNARELQALIDDLRAARAA
jgi:DNA-binding NarL/FixJ family response regulator